MYLISVVKNLQTVSFLHSNLSTMLFYLILVFLLFVLLNKTLIILTFRRIIGKVWQEVNNLMQDDFPAEDFLNSPPIYDEPSDTDSDNEFENDIINKSYHLRLQHRKIMKKFSINTLEFVDAGGFGEIHLGRTIKNGCVTDEKIAVKLLEAPSLDTVSLKKWRRACKREMYYIHQLNDHENVVNIFDYYWLYNPEQKLFPAYLAIKFEHLEISLDKCIDEGFDFNFQTIGKIATQIGSAIEYMHEKKIVHHDIKPENIMIAKFDDQEKKKINNQTIFKLIDFGLARQAREKVGIKWLENRAGCGTIPYMCEEMLNSFGSYNPYLADSYAFGATLLHIVMGDSFSNQIEALFASGVYQQFLIDTWTRPDLETYLTHPHYLKAIGDLLKPQTERPFVFQVLPMFHNDTTCPIEEHLVQPDGGWPIPGDSFSRLCRSIH